jgi:predicted aspartyl protease
MRNSLLAFCGMLILATAQTGAGAKTEECQRLRQIASLDMTLTDDGRILVPVGIENAQKYFMIDTGAPASVISPEVVAEIGLKTRVLPQDAFVNFQGRTLRESAVIDTVVIGGLKAKQVRMLVSPDILDSEHTLAGLIGADMLIHNDVELDFKAKKLNLFSQEHCRGRVIYWPATAVAVVPIKVEASGHITFSVKLDGKPVEALLDTGATDTLLEIDVARGTFGIDLGDENTPQIAPGTDNSPPYYLHKFDTLDFDGVAISHPKIVIYKDEAKKRAKASPSLGSRIASVDSSGGFTNMIVGINLMRYLHIYIAYGEQTMYITPP